MSASTGMKRKRLNGLPKKTSRKSKRSTAYHSSSDDDERDEEMVTTAVGELYEPLASDGDAESNSGVRLPNLLENGEADSEDEIRDAEELPSENDSADPDADEDLGSGSELDSQSSDSESREKNAGHAGDRTRKPRKRNDPAQFATSISKILSSKLTRDKRNDPVLSRSKDATELSKGLTEERLEAKAKRKLRDDKKVALNKGRETDVLGLQREDVSAGAVAEEERQLKKMAQRGVIKLFNAVRAAQTQGEQAAREARGQGVIGTDKRQEHVNEMSKKSFLDLLVDGN